MSTYAEAEKTLVDCPVRLRPNAAHVCSRPILPVSIKWVFRAPADMDRDDLTYMIHTTIRNPDNSGAFIDYQGNALLV